ncbi:MAG: Hsp20/alpha crystallin family protein [Bdellovibrionales bacterium]|nr:Hsp20/alpha crystallin family protein [Bdellovibrionales bacterium]
MRTGLINRNSRPSLWDLVGDVDAFFGNGFLSERENSNQANFQPAVNIVENEANFLISADLPGMKKEDIHIDLNDGVLSLSGERSEEKETSEQNFRRFEKRYGKFVRSFRLPENVQSEKIEAKYENGVLEVNIPKSEKAMPKKIQVKS